MERFSVESASRPGTYHVVAIEGCEADCDCEAFAYRHTCRHVDKARALMDSTVNTQTMAHDSAGWRNWCRLCGRLYWAAWTGSGGHVKRCELDEVTPHRCVANA